MPDPKSPREPRDDTDTPVEGVPIEPMNTIAHRTRAAATDAKATLDTVNSLRIELLESDKRNKIEHQTTNDKIGGLDERVGRLEDHVGNLRVDGARSEGKLDLILEDMSNIKEAALHREKVTTETHAVHQKALIETQAVEQKVTIEEAADIKKTRRFIVAKVVAVLAAIGTGVVPYLGLR